LAAKVIFLVIVGAACSYTDIKKRLILNKVTLPAAAAGVILNAYEAGWKGVSDSLGGLALGFGVSFLIALWGGYGGGDVKMTAAFGAIGGTRFILYCMMYAAVIDGVVAVAVLVLQKRLRLCLSALSEWVACTLAGEKRALPSFGSIPHAPSLAAAGLVASVVVFL